MRKISHYDELKFDAQIRCYLWNCLERGMSPEDFLEMGLIDTFAYLRLKALLESAKRGEYELDNETIDIQEMED